MLEAALSAAATEVVLDDPPDLNNEGRRKCISLAFFQWDLVDDAGSSFDCIETRRERGKTEGRRRRGDTYHGL